MPGYDHLSVDLVTKKVDRDIGYFTVTRNFMAYCRREAEAFLRGLPFSIKNIPSSEFTPEERSGLYTCDRSAYGLALGFYPEFPLQVSSGKVVATPRFSLRFKPIEKGNAGRILEEALDHFYLYEHERVGVRAERAAVTVAEGLEVLLPFLSRSVKRIELRSNPEQRLQRRSLRLPIQSL